MRNATQAESILIQESIGPKNKHTTINNFTSPIPNGEVFFCPFFSRILLVKTIQAASKQQINADVKTCFAAVHNTSIT